MATKVTIVVKCEYRQLALKEVYSKQVQSSWSKNYSSAMNRVNGSASASGSYKLFSAEAQATWDNFNSRVNSTESMNYSLNEKKVVFQDGYLQIFRKIVTEIVVGTERMKSEEEVLVNTRCKDDSYTDEKLSELAINHMKENYKGSGLSGATYTACSQIENIEYVKRVYGKAYDHAQCLDGNFVKCVNGSDDINRGFEGKFTYLFAEKTTNPDAAATGFKFHKSTGWCKNMGADLAKGTGGAFRFIQTLNDRRHKKILWKNVHLFRCSNPNQKSGSLSYTGDLNKDRDGDYLYLSWNTDSEIVLKESNLYAIRSCSSNNYLEGRTPRLTEVCLTNCDPKDKFLNWYLEGVDGNWAMKSVSSGKYLDGRNSNFAKKDGAVLVTDHDPKGYRYLQWKLEPVGHGNFAIKSVSSGLYLNGRNKEHVGNKIWLTRGNPKTNKYLHWSIIPIHYYE